jgi:PKD repeat protein
MVFNKTTFASHFGGCDISYTCTSTPNIYKVTMKIYRDCSGVFYCTSCANPIPNGNVSGCTTATESFTNTITGATGTFTGINYGSFTLNAVATTGIDIVQTCTSLKTICTNCNTRTAGTYSPGVEVYVFEGNVNLSSIPAACCKVILGTSTCCWNGAITTFVPGSFYSEAILDRCQTTCNSAPIFTNNATPVICSGVDYVYNLGAIDPDGDSLSYEFAPSLQAANTNVNYYAPYSPSYPFPYLGAPNPNAAFPAGFRIDPSTGDVRFRPIGIFVTSLVIVVTQWKQIAGIWTNIGYSKREAQFQTKFCANSIAPKIKIYKEGILQSTNKFNTMGGVPFCLDIVCQDQQDSLISADTTDLTWNNPGLYSSAMSNAIFTRNYILAQRGMNGPKADSFKFCWTPPITAIRSTPYSFTVNGTDRSCPIKNSLINSINLTVKPLTQIRIDSIVTIRIFCNDRTTNPNVKYQTTGLSLLGNNVFTVQLSDSLGSFTNASTIGTKASTDTTGLIAVVIPANLPINKNYKIRVNCSSDTSFKGNEMSISFVNGFAKPTITSNKDSLCAGLTVFLQASPIGSDYTYKWLKNNQIITNATNDNFTINNDSNYQVIVSNAGCTDTSLVKKITTFPKPIANIGLSTFCASPNPVNIVNSSTIASGTMSYYWTFSDSTFSTALSPNKIFTDSGSINANLVVTSNLNCKDSVTKTITISLMPKANFTINDTLQCITGNKFELNNTSLGPIINYNWSFGDNSFSANSNPSKTYTNSGNFSIKLKASNNGCADSIIKPITVVAKASNVNFSINQGTQCFNGNNFVFTNNSAPNNSSLNYFWTFGNGDTSILRSPNITFNGTGTFAVKLKVTSNNKCVDSFTNNVIVKANPMASFSINDTIQCITGNKFDFINSSIGTNNTYTWAFGDNSSTISINPFKTYTNAGNYLVKLITTSNGCLDSIIKPITVVAKASNVNFSTNQGTQCFNGNNFVFTNNSTPSNSSLNYFWTFGNGDTSTLRSTIITFNSVGTYAIKLKVTSNKECVDSFTNNVIVNAHPKANFNINDTLQCITGNKFSLLNSTTGGSTYTWNFGDNTINNNVNNSKVYINAGNYAIKLIASTANGCSDSIIKNVNVVAKATNVDFSVNQMSQCLRGNNFVFTNSSTPNNTTLSYLWTFDNFLTSTLRNPTNFSTTKLGLIPVSLVVVANGKCIDSIAKNIMVNPSPQIGTILGNTSPNSNIVPFTYSVLNQANSTYSWNTNNGTIQSGQGTNQISVLFTNAGNAKITAQITDNNSCTDSTSLNLAVTVGINELSLEHDLKVFPNPTKSTLTITNKTNIFGKKYIITNLIGQTILSGKLNLDETIINTESLTNGVYLLSVEGLNKQAIKIIKE